MNTAPDRDLQAGRVRFGRYPGLIVVDMTRGFTSPESPLGGNVDNQVAAAVTLVDRFHAASLPVMFSSVVYDDDDNAYSVFRHHLPDLNILKRGSDWVEIDPRFNRRPEDVVIEKGGPSAFFATSLHAVLCQKGCDSVMVCGLSTSGCVRATVVDALQYNYPAWVVEQACGDRNHSAHTANLHDMHAKYAEVVSLDRALACVSQISEAGHG